MNQTAPHSSADTIGFIGLGHMGSNFARRLLEAGHRLTVFDAVPEKREALLQAGASAAEDTAALVRECSLVLASLPNSRVTEQVLENDVLPHLRPGTIVVDLGTTEVGATRKLAAAFQARQAFLLDAPVSGDPRHPVHIFVGGEESAFDRARPLLAVLAHPDHLTLGGPSGAGQILKGVNQLCMGLVSAAWLEAISFATRQGIDPETVGRAVGGESGWRRQLVELSRKIAGGKGEHDDLKFAELPYFLKAAEEAGLALPLTRALFEFCDPGPRDWRDNMNRPYVSFWHMLQGPRRK
ncbi:MAG: NAD(P)-dependent oxidoreductase [Puniceicoccaceae bacterium]|nr:MAG: NAD(P)-dependent oxidoreductase [Puniceicoccaceae bacterium]